MPPRLRIFVLFTGAYFLSYFFRSANAVIAGDLRLELALSPAQLGLMTSLFYVTFALVQLPLGSALDRFGPRLVTPGLMMVGAVGSLVFAVAPSFAVLALGRALIGVGMAGVLMGSLKAFTAWFPAARFATVSGLLIGIGASGALVAARPLAELNALIGWRLVFAWGALIIALCALAISLFARNAPPGVRPPVRQAGGGFGEVFREGRFWRIALLNFTTAGALLSVQGLWAGPYLLEVAGVSAQTAGSILTLMGIGAMVGFLLSGLLADRFGLVRTMLLSTALFTLTQALLILPGLGLAAPPLALLYALFGFAGAFNVVLLAQARVVFPAHLSGRATSAVNLFGIGGSALLQWWLGLIIGAFTPTAAGGSPPAAYAAAFAVLTLLGLLALVAYAPLAGRSQLRPSAQR